MLLKGQKADHSMQEIYHKHNSEGSQIFLYNKQTEALMSLMVFPT